jgi:hypothetical protein
MHKRSEYNVKEFTTPFVQRKKRVGIKENCSSSHALFLKSARNIRLVGNFTSQDQLSAEELKFISRISSQLIDSRRLEIDAVVK